MADRDILVRMDAHMERGNQHMERGNQHMERGNELMDEVKPLFAMIDRMDRLDPARRPRLIAAARPSGRKPHRVRRRAVAATPIICHTHA